MAETAPNPTDGQTAPAPAASDAQQGAASTGSPATGQQQQAAATKDQQKPAAGTSVLEAGKDAGQQKGDAKAGEPTGDKPQGAPERYEFKMPQGAELSGQVLSAYSDVAKELGLPQEAAQKVLDKVLPAMQAREAEVREQARTQFSAATANDQEFGGDKLQASKAIAQKALESFGTPELRTLLEETGLEHHPEIWRLLYRAGSAVSEDTLVTGKAGPQGPKDPNKLMFPNMK